MKKSDEDILREAHRLQDYFLAKPGWTTVNRAIESLEEQLTMVHEENRSFLIIADYRPEPTPSKIKFHLRYDITYHEVFCSFAGKYFAFSKEDLKWLDLNGFDLAISMREQLGQNVEDWIYDEE